MKSTVSNLIAVGVLALSGILEARSQPADSGSAPQAVAASGATAKDADRVLRKQVVRALSRTKGLQSRAITVRVKGGVVALQGTVPEEAQVDLATRAAQGVPGVTAVTNSLTLSTF